jgi:8-amino-7-oxononanoate synthase/acyl carrier protein
MLKDELGRLNCLRQSERRFQDLYNILIYTDPQKAAALWLDDEEKECSRSFQQFDEDIRAVAALFRHRIGEENEGNFVALMMENRYHWSVAFWGLLMAGYKPMLFDVNHKEPMVRHLLTASGAVALVGRAEMELPVPRVALEEIVGAQPDTSFVPRFADELALCTSGTTSTSKVYVYNEDAIIEQTLGVIPKVTECARLIEDKKDPIRHLAFLPMHHVLGFMVHCILFPVVGKTVVYIKDRAPQTIQQACKHFRVTNLIVVPLLLNNLSSGLWKKARQDGKERLLKIMFGLSNSIQRLLPRKGPDIASKITKSIQQKLLGDSIRTILVGGTHIPLNTLKTINGLGYYPMPGFGMTEVGLTSFETRPQAFFRMSGSTAPIAGISYKTVDADGNHANTGELLIKGKSMHVARLIDGERQPPEYGEDGWFRSGDIARLAKGGLYIEGRLKEVIINESGENVYPDELEDIFEGLSGIERLCVLSLTNSTQNEDITLVFQLPDNNIDPQTVAIVAAEISVRNAKLPVLKRVRRLFVAAQPLPLANGIKVRRQKLKEWIETAEIDVRPVDMKSGTISGAADGCPTCYNKEKDIHTTDEEAISQIREEVARCFATVLTMDATLIGYDKHFFDDLGGDSLDSLNLLVRVETSFGLMINEQEFRECSTVNDVAYLIWRKRTGQANPSSPLSGAEIVPVTRFTDSREYLTFQERMKEMAHAENPYFIHHDGVLTDISLVNGREVLNFASYNYICMSGHPETVRAACEATERYGTSASGSRLLAGEKGLFCELENEIAAWKHTEAALVLVSGHATNVTFVGNFCNERDLILYDTLSHNSILQGCLLSRAKCRAFPHNNVKALEDILKMSRASFEKILLVVEGVYSMDGDIAPINEFVRLKKEYGLILMVDEAHSACVIGERGGGVDEYFGLEPSDIDIKMGTLSKGLGACGGYLAGSQALIQYLRYNVPGFVFSVGISPPVAAAALAALRILRRDPAPVAALRKNISCFVNAAREADLNICLAGETAIIPILIGDETDAFRLSGILLERGISVPPAVFPAVAMGKARLRFCVTSSHKEEQINFAIAQLKESAKQAGIDLPKFAT